MSLKSKFVNAKEKVVTFVDENRDRIKLACAGAGVAIGSLWWTYTFGIIKGTQIGMKAKSYKVINQTCKMIEDNSDLTFDDVENIFEEHGKDYGFKKIENV